MFKRINTQPVAETVGFTWNGQPMTGQAGDTVASALLAAGVQATRLHPVTEEPRAAFCMMGICFECLVEVDGVANVQGCQVRLAEGMRVVAQKGART